MTVESYKSFVEMNRGTHYCRGHPRRMRRRRRHHCRRRRPASMVEAMRSRHQPLGHHSRHPRLLPPRAACLWKRCRSPQTNEIFPVFVSLSFAPKCPSCEVKKVGEMGLLALANVLFRYSSHNILMLAEVETGLIN